MATTTISYKLDPSETPYVHGSVPLTPNQVIAAQVYGIGSLVIVIICMIWIAIYCTFYRPRKLQERAEAAARGDVEVQKPKKPFELSARWKAPKHPPNAKVRWWNQRELPEPLTNGSFR